MFLTEFDISYGVLVANLFPQKRICTQGMLFLLVNVIFVVNFQKIPFMAFGYVITSNQCGSQLLASVSFGPKHSLALEI